MAVICCTNHNLNYIHYLLQVTDLCLGNRKMNNECLQASDTTVLPSSATEISKPFCGLNKEQHSILRIGKQHWILL